MTAQGSVEAAAWLCSCGRRGEQTYNARDDSRLERRRALAVHAAIWSLRAHQDLDACQGVAMRHPPRAPGERL